MMVEEGNDLYIVVQGLVKVAWWISASLARITWHLLRNVLPWPTWISIFLHLASKKRSFIQWIRTHPKAVKLSYVVYYTFITTKVFVGAYYEMITSFWDIFHSEMVQRLWIDFGQNWTFDLDYEMVLSRLVYHAALLIGWASLKKFKSSLSEIIANAGKSRNREPTILKATLQNVETTRS